MGGITRLLLLLWAGVTVSTPVDLHKRILGGTTCNDNEHQYHVKLELDNGHGRIEYCGGSLISKRWILTAAHCWDNTMTAHLGLHPQTSTVKTKQIIKAEPYKSNMDTHDIMLLKMSEDAPAEIPHVDLPDCGSHTKLTEVEMAGYGPTSATSKTHSTILLCAKTKLVQCGYETHEHRFCGDTDNEKRIAMPSDSGGGAVHDGKIYGVISEGTSAHVYYMDVCKYKEWIQQTMKT